MKGYKNPDQNISSDETPDPVVTIQKVIDSLLLFIPKTLAKRLIAIVLLAADTPVPRVMGLSGLSDRSVRGFRKSLKDGNAAGLPMIKTAPGQEARRKLLKPGLLRKWEKTTTIHSSRPLTWSKRSLASVFPPLQ